MLDTARLPASRSSHKAGLEMHPDATHIERLKEVGRYALGVEWGDRHESILPYKNLRLACPCDACTAAAPDASLAPEAERPVDFQVLGDRSLFIRWADANDVAAAPGTTLASRTYDGASCHIHHGDQRAASAPLARSRACRAPGRRGLARAGAGELAHALRGRDDRGGRSPRRAGDAVGGDGPQAHERNEAGGGEEPLRMARHQRHRRHRP